MLPAEYQITLVLLVVSMLSWGSWANTTKLTGKWPFELFYFDYALGVLILAAVAAFTLGEMSDGIGFWDNLVLMSFIRYRGFAFLAGCIFNLANMLLVAAITISGMSVAFPIGIGLAMIVGVVWSYILRPVGSPIFLFGGAALVVGAIIIDAIAYRAQAQAQLGKKASGVTTRGIVLSLISGLLMGSFYPLVEMSTTPTVGLTPYGAAFMFAIGVFLSTFIFNLYFINLPVTGGAPVQISGYFKGSIRQHGLGILGGIIWCIGAVTNFVAAHAEAGASVGPAVSYALGQGATMISVLWGLLVWKEFKGASGKVTGLLTLMFVLFAAGLTMIALAPLMASK